MSISAVDGANSEGAPAGTFCSLFDNVVADLTCPAGSYAVGSEQSAQAQAENGLTTGRPARPIPALRTIPIRSMRQSRRAD